MTDDKREDIDSSYEETPVDPDYAIEKEEVEPLPEFPAAYTRAENEDDDGYDPYSDRPRAPEGPERDPWS